jgi:hypothetical protein
MKKKVLGFLLLLLVGLTLVGCSTTRVTASANGSITFELHNGQEVISTKAVLFYEGDTLLGLLKAQYSVACADAQNQQDFTCSYVGQWGVFLLVIGDLVADPTKNEYLGFYINGEYAMTGIDSTDIVDGAVYQFRHESY